HLQPFSLCTICIPPRSSLFPYTTLFRSDTAPQPRCGFFITSVNGGCVDKSRAVIGYISGFFEAMSGAFDRSDPVIDQVLRSATIGVQEFIAIGNLDV